MQNTANRQARKVKTGWIIGGLTAVFITILGLYLLRALPALLAAQFSDLTVIRPFF